MSRVPENEFTRMIDRVSGVNQGMGRVEGSVTATPPPNARSAALGTQVVIVPPLTASEKAELDAQAALIGIVPFNEVESAGPYNSLAEAQAVATPVVTKENVAPSFAHQSAREYVPRPSFPRLPDFNKAAVLDLGRGVIYLDELEFPIPEADLAEFRAFAITAVHANLTARLNAALHAVVPARPEETTDGAARDEAVQPVPEGEEPGSVQSSEQE